jgi:hypothetical protein
MGKRNVKVKCQSKPKITGLSRIHFYDMNGLSLHTLVREPVLQQASKHYNVIVAFKILITVEATSVPKTTV